MGLLPRQGNEPLGALGSTGASRWAAGAALLPEEGLVTQTCVLIRTRPRARLRLRISFHAGFALKGKKNHKQMLGSSQVIIHLLRAWGQQADVCTVL